MNTFWVVTLFHADVAADIWEPLLDASVSRFGAMGVEEFSIDEPEVDRILGERSYSGGDLPSEVLDEVEDVLKTGAMTARFFFENEKEARAFHQELSGTVLGESQVEEHPMEDWNAEWKKHYSPIVVNDQLTIVPSWQTDFRAQRGQSLFINPGMGFGTGSHETTFLCLKLFTEDCPTDPKTVLDFGSGSGILGLASMKLSPEARVDFYDIDPEANENCFQNASINGLAKRQFRLLLPQVRNLLQPEYDIVFANILENILIEESDFLVSRVKPGGSLILSGLLRHQSAGIISRYKSSLSFVKEVTKGDWSALLFRRKE